MKKTILFYGLFIMFFLVGCTGNSLSNQYISKAKKITDKYDVLDATITLKEQVVQNSTVVYHLEIRSDYFRNQFSANDTYAYLFDLYQIIDNTDPRTSPVVISGDRTYSLNPQLPNIYTVNGENVNIYNLPTKSAPIQTIMASTLVPILTEPTDDEKAFAWVAAKQEVEARLKSPSTAEFPFSYSGQYIMKSGGNTFIIRIIC